MRPLPEMPPLPAGSIDSLNPLIAEFGERNVEETLIFIARACDSKGLHVMLRWTPEMVRAVLEAVHGRTGVNEIRVNG